MKTITFLGLRFAALLYDAFPIIALWMAVGALALGITQGQMDPRHPPMLYQFALLSTTAVYFIFSWTRGGQTIGMRAWRLKLVSSQHSRSITITQALLRLTVAFISLTVFGLGFLWAFIDTEGHTWHDRIAKTQLVRLPKT